MMALLQSSRCDAVGYDATHCPFFREARGAHVDAQVGDNVPHMNQVDITIRVDGASVDECPREIGWYYNHQFRRGVMEAGGDILWDNGKTWKRHCEGATT